MPQKFLISLSISIALILMMAACQLKEPVLPAWETTVRLPFTTGKFILGEEMVNDSTIILQTGDPDSILYIKLMDSGVDLREISAGDLSIKIDNGSEKITLDTLVLTTLQTLDVPLINLRTLFPGLSGAVGQNVTVPETTVTIPPTELEAGDFKRIHFLSGAVRLHVVNKLPFPVGPNSSAPSGLRITVVNDSLNETFAEFTFPNTIFPGAEAVSEASIENKWLYSPLRFEYLVPVSQPTTVMVTNALLDTAGVALSVFLENIRADEAVAVLEAQNFSETIRLGYQNKHRLRSAEIERGQFNLTFTNYTPLNTDVKIKIPALQNAFNDTFTTEMELPAGETLPLTLQLDNYTISNPDIPGELIDTVALVMDVRSKTPGNLVHITASDSISVNVVTDTLVFTSFSGFLGEDTLEFDPVTEENIADYEGFEGGIELSEAFLDLKIYSEILIENLTADLTITGFHRNKNGAITDSAAILLNNQQFNGGTPAQPGITEISLMGQEIVDFLSILPTAIRVKGRAKVSGEAAIAQGNRIWVDYLFETPFKVHIQGTASFEGTESLIREEDIDQLIQDAAADNILDVDFTFFLTNHSPLRGDIRFIVSSDFSDPDIYDENYDTSRVIIRNIPVEPAPVDPLTGFVTSAREDEILLHLNQREVQLFSSPPLRYGYQLIVPDTGGFITLRYSDFVNMIGRADLRVLVEDQ